MFGTLAGGPRWQKNIVVVCLLTLNRNNWGVRHFSRFVEKWLPNRRRAEIKVKGSGQECPLYTAGGRIFILRTSHSFTLTRPVSPRK